MSPIYAQQIARFLDRALDADESEFASEPSTQERTRRAMLCKNASDLLACAAGYDDDEAFAAATRAVGIITKLAAKVGTRGFQRRQAQHLTENLRKEAAEAAL